MNKQKIESCEKLCREFLERAKAMKARATESQKGCNVEYSFNFWTNGTREAGALRRTSMELTRALADLRRAG